MFIPKAAPIGWQKREGSLQTSQAVLAASWRVGFLEENLSGKREGSWRDGKTHRRETALRLRPSEAGELATNKALSCPQTPAGRPSQPCCAQSSACPQPLEILEFPEGLSSSGFHFPQHKSFSPGSQTTAVSLSMGTSAVIFPVV